MTYNYTSKRQLTFQIIAWQNYYDGVHDILNGSGPAFWTSIWFDFVSVDPHSQPPCVKNAMVISVPILSFRLSPFSVACDIIIFLGKDNHSAGNYIYERKTNVAVVVWQCHKGTSQDKRRQLHITRRRNIKGNVSHITMILDSRFIHNRSRHLYFDRVYVHTVVTSVVDRRP